LFLMVTKFIKVNFVTEISNIYNFDKGEIA
jgi:hypothetical protein